MLLFSVETNRDLTSMCLPALGISYMFALIGLRDQEDGFKYRRRVRARVRVRRLFNVL